MKIHDKFKQGSEQWFKARQGRATASAFGRIITPAKLQLSKQRLTYMDELLAERYIPTEELLDEIESDENVRKAMGELSYLFTGEKFVGNKYTDHGLEYEDEARKHFAATYCADSGRRIEEVGFVTDDRGFLGCSPDSFIYDAEGNIVAGWECKCKCLKNLITAIREGVLPTEHLLQVHGSMAVTGLNEWHFYCYFPGKKPFHVIVKRDSTTEKVERLLQEFTIEFGAMIEKVSPLLSTRKEMIC